MFNNIELTKEQQLFFDIFDNYLQNRQNKLYPSDRRAWGKTTIINEIGFTYQALGYEVLLITHFPNANEHFANRCIFNEWEFSGVNREKTIVIIDEYDVQKNYDARFLLEELRQLNIPYVGFAKI